MIKRSAFLSLLIVAVACSTSVVDLSAVTSFSAKIQKAADAIDQLPTDYANNFRAQLEFSGETALGTLGRLEPGSRLQPQNYNVNPSSTLAPLSLATPSEASTPAPMPSPEPTITPGPTCASVQHLADRWGQLNTTVI